MQWPNLQQRRAMASVCLFAILFALHFGMSHMHDIYERQRQEEARHAVALAARKARLERLSSAGLHLYPRHEEFLVSPKASPLADLLSGWSTTAYWCVLLPIVLYILICLNCWFWPYWWPLKIQDHEKDCLDEYLTDIGKALWSRILAVARPFVWILKGLAKVTFWGLRLLWNALVAASIRRWTSVRGRLRDYASQIDLRWTTFTQRPFLVEAWLKYVAACDFVRQWWFPSLMVLMVLWWAWFNCWESWQEAAVDLKHSIRQRSTYVDVMDEDPFNPDFSYSEARVQSTIMYTDFIKRTAYRPAREWPSTNTAAATKTVTSIYTTTDITTVTVTETSYRRVKVDMTQETVTEHEIFTPVNPVIKVYQRNPSKSYTETATERIRDRTYLTSTEAVTKYIKDYIQSISTETVTKAEYKPTTTTETMISTRAAGSTETYTTLETIHITKISEAPPPIPTTMLTETTVTEYAASPTRSFYVPGSIDKEADLTSEELEKIRGPMVFRDTAYDKKESKRGKHGYNYCAICKQRHGHETIYAHRGFVWENERPVPRVWPRKVLKQVEDEHFFR